VADPRVCDEDIAEEEVRELRLYSVMFTTLLVCCKPYRYGCIGSRGATAESGTKSAVHAISC